MEVASINIKSVFEIVTEPCHHCVKVNSDKKKNEVVTEDSKKSVRDICNAHGVEVKHPSV